MFVKRMLHSIKCGLIKAETTVICQFEAFLPDYQQLTD